MIFSRLERWTGQDLRSWPEGKEAEEGKLKRVKCDERLWKMLNAYVSLKYHGILWEPMPMVSFLATSFYYEANNSVNIIQHCFICAISK